nr:MAG TPA: hypothetical protein [Caudoviricetes sp.]
MIHRAYSLSCSPTVHPQACSCCCRGPHPK